MPYHIAYAVVADSIDTISEAIEAATEFLREGHESSHLGVYDLFRVPEQLVIKYNFVDEECEWDYPEHQDRDVLIVAQQTERPDYIDGIIRDLGVDVVVVERRQW